jgi:hypothetical protein
MHELHELSVYTVAVKIIRLANKISLCPLYLNSYIS